MTHQHTAATPLNAHTHTHPHRCADSACSTYPAVVYYTVAVRVLRQRFKITSLCVEEGEKSCTWAVDGAEVSWMPTGSFLQCRVSRSSTRGDREECRMSDWRKAGRLKERERVRGEKRLNQEREVENWKKQESWRGWKCENNRHEALRRFVLQRAMSRVAQSTCRVCFNDFNQAFWWKNTGWAEA